MTSHSSTTLPPRWAESLLRMLLPPEDRDSVSGDLLEEYRESIVPALGAKATGWYVRQVAGYVLRKAWIWGALVGAILVTRYLFDTLAPVRYTPGVVHPRSAIMSYALIATFALGSGWQAWRSGHLGSGVLVAFATAAFGGALSAAGTVACLAIWHDSRSGGGGSRRGPRGALWGGAPLLLPLGALPPGPRGGPPGGCPNALSPGATRQKEEGGFLSGDGPRAPPLGWAAGGTRGGCVDSGGPGGGRDPTGPEAFSCRSIVAIGSWRPLPAERARLRERQGRPRGPGRAVRSAPQPGGRPGRPSFAEGGGGPKCGGLTNHIWPTHEFAIFPVKSADHARYGSSISLRPVVSRPVPW